MSLFKLKTTESHTFKTLAELLASCIKNAAFVINSAGLRLTCVDNKSSAGNTCFDLKLPSKNFLEFYFNPAYAKSEFTMGLDLVNFYKILKTIKKKDVLIFEIDEQEPQKLTIVIQQSFEAEANAMRSSVQIISVPADSSPSLEYEQRPTVCGAKEFARIRTFHKVDSVISQQFGQGWCTFSTSNGTIVSKSLLFGAKNHQGNQVVYDQKFESETLTQLVKIAGISQIIRIFHEPELPLKIEIDVGPLGSLAIYIKSLELLEIEKLSSLNQKKDEISTSFDTQDYLQEVHPTILHR